MGDRCYLEITLKRSDLQRFYEATGTKADDWSLVGSEIAITQLNMDEANYALGNALSDAAGKGIVFHGWHGAGNNYPKETFVTYDNTVMYCRYDGGAPIIKLYMKKGRYVVDDEDVIAINVFRVIKADVESDFYALEHDVLR